MVKRWLLVGGILLLVSLLLTGCGVPKEDYEAVVTERDSVQSELQSVRSELDTVKPELQSVRSELDTVKPELQSVRSELDTAQSELQSARSELSAAQLTIETQEQKIAKAKIFAEVISSPFVPALKGEEVPEAEWLLQWWDKTQEAGDAELERLFKAAMHSEGADPEMTELFLYLFENLPKLLE